MEKNPYEILGVSREATEKEIKSKYFKLAKTHHPDVSKAADAQKKFVEITNAYAILRDPQKRAQLDAQLHGNTFFGGTSGGGTSGSYGSQQQYQQPFSGWQNVHWGPAQKDIRDIFSELEREMFNMMNNNPQTEVRRERSGPGFRVQFTYRSSGGGQHRRKTSHFDPSDFHLRSIEELMKMFTSGGHQYHRLHQQQQQQQQYYQQQQQQQQQFYQQQQQFYQQQQQQQHQFYGRHRQQPPLMGGLFGDLLSNIFGGMNLMGALAWDWGTWKKWSYPKISVCREDIKGRSFSLSSLPSSPSSPNYFLGTIEGSETKRGDDLINISLFDPNRQEIISGSERKDDNDFPLMDFYDSQSERVLGSLKHHPIWSAFWPYYGNQWFYTPQGVLAAKVTTTTVPFHGSEIKWKTVDDTLFSTSSRPWKPRWMKTATKIVCDDKIRNSIELHPGVIGITTAMQSTGLRANKKLPFLFKTIRSFFRK